VAIEFIFALEKTFYTGKKHILHWKTEFPKFFSKYFCKIGEI
jgi:hypothetical protein